MKIQDQIQALITNQFKVGVVLLLLPFCSFARPISITIFDTAFCISHLENIPKNVSIHKVFDATNSNNVICKDLKIKNRRFHGYFVLRELISHLKEVKNKIEIYPIIIFDKDGSQSNSSWKSALEWAKSKKIDVLLTAIGLPVKNSPNYSLLPINFIASGQKGIGVSIKTKIFPQEVATKVNSIIVGNYLKNELADDLFVNPDLLYKNKISYYFHSEKGSSFAVATALGRALKLCSGYLSRSVNYIACLRKHEKILYSNYKTY